MSTEVTLSVDAGAKFVLPVVHQDNEGAAIDLTGYTFEWVVNVIGPNTYTDEPEITVDDDPTTGKLTLKLTGEQTGLFTRIRGYHRLRATAPGDTDGPVDVIKGSIDVNILG